MKSTKKMKTENIVNVKTITELLDTSLIAYRNRYFARIYEGDDERYLTFYDLHNDVGRLMHSFVNKKKEHVAFICDFSYEFIALFLAVIRSGNIAIPINPNLNKEDLLNKIHFADINHIFIDKKYANLFLDNSIIGCAFSFSAVIWAVPAVAHFCRVLKTVKHHYAASLGKESWDGCHHPF